MADRAAPMSSEEEARKAVDTGIDCYGRTRQAYGQNWKPYGTGGELLQRYADQLQPDRDALNAALDEYRTAIERRVLAQQPCYFEGMLASGDCSQQGLEPKCVTCQARAAQTQETSG